MPIMVLLRHFFPGTFLPLFDRTVEIFQTGRLEEYMGTPRGWNSSGPCGIWSHAQVSLNNCNLTHVMMEKNNNHRLVWES